MNTSIPTLLLKLAPELLPHGELGAIRTLGRVGVGVYAVHDATDAPAAYSRYAAGGFVWNGSTRATADVLRFLRDTARQIGCRSVLIPQDDASNHIVDAAADTLREWFIFPEQPRGLVRTLSNKREMNLLCQRLGVATASTVFPENEHELEEFLAHASFPIVLKGAEPWVPELRGRSRIVIARSRKAALAAYRAMSEPERANLMLQEYIPGEPQSIWMFNGYFDRESKCLFGSTGRKLRQAPPYTGPTSLGVCVQNDQVAAITTSLMKDVGYRGILDIGFCYDVRDGQYKLLDVNPRLGASFRLFVDPANGLDVVRALYLDMTGQPVPTVRHGDGRKWLVEPWDLRSSIRYHRDGVLTVRRWLGSFRGVQEAAWFAKDDPLPFVNVSLRLARGAIRRRVRSDARGR